MFKCLVTSAPRLAQGRAHLAELSAGFDALWMLIVSYSVSVPGLGFGYPKPECVSAFLWRQGTGFQQRQDLFILLRSADAALFGVLPSILLFFPLPFSFLSHLPLQTSQIAQVLYL